MDKTFDPGAGKRYEDAYGGWLTFFREIAESELTPVVRDVPTCWAPLCYYLGATVLNTREYFHCDPWVWDWREAIAAAEASGRVREYVEHVCTLRPELVDSLYQADVKWKTRNVKSHPRKEFVVTNSSSYQREEVRVFMEKLRAYKPTLSKAVLVPCAADKPYPSPLHKAVRAIVPPTYELIIATGVLGLVPEALWPEMPHYDSGIPNEWRLMKAVEDYFGRNVYSDVVVYCDYYNEAIARGMPHSVRVFYVNPCTDGYLDLLDETRLERLRTSVNVW